MNVAVFFGGKSSEHDISIITGVMTLNVMSDSVHNVFPIYIDRKGHWWTAKSLNNVKRFSQPNFLKKCDQVHIRPSDSNVYTSRGKKLHKIDVAILCCHGMNGEDGSLQGLLQLSSIPYTGSGMRSSAICMDKISMKQIFAVNNLPIVEYVGFSKYEYETNLYELVTKIKEKLTFPMIVKPSNLGSSIGISKATTWAELFDAIAVALKWDNRVIIERALTDFIEVNCACLGMDNDVLASEVEQPIGWKDFLSFDDKYVKNIKSTGIGRKMPADITSEQTAQVKNLATTCFKCVGSSGVARIDFMLEGDNIYVNEINTIPGSMANYLFSYSGMSYLQLLERMLDIALKAHRNDNSLQFSFISPVLSSKNFIKK